MKNDVYVKKTNIYQYDNETLLNPSKVFAEGINIDIKSDKNIYSEFRDMLYEMGFDKDNFNKKDWNPFKTFIKKGNVVLIKPNLVKHINQCIDGDTNSLITNFSIIRPIIDYTILALNGTGRIIVADAPVQECEFSKVIKINGLQEAIQKYNESGYKIELIDFRKNNNNDLKCKIVSIDKDSSLFEVDKYAKKYAITNYNLKYIQEHHNYGKHEYLIPNDVLSADVIINVPKPKTHRKAGITACMKNFVGVNAKKEYLPHHRNGSVTHNGDEYPENNFIKNIKSYLKNYTYLHNKLINLSNGILNFLLKKTNKSRYQEGSWYGNDTIWRTILDINKIILYTNKKGQLTNKRQRIIFNIADMIISGEKEGPLLPSNKKVGIIVAGFNQLNVDNTICQLMGFDPQKIKYIENGYKLQKYKISLNKNYNTYINNKLESIKKYNTHFIPTDGWIDYLLESKAKEGKVK